MFKELNLIQGNNSNTHSRMGLLTKCPYFSKKTEALVMEKQLQKALSNNEFILNYQPQVNLKSKKIVGLEALIRWVHPIYGTISPATFIPIAEQSNLIASIGKWVLQEACNELSKINQLGYTDVSISVNLSNQQLLYGDFVSFVKEVIQNTKIQSNKLTLEITESMTMDYEVIIPILQKLQHLGVNLAVDDFGTGYSSLSYIRKLPINRLKIDRSFVNDATEHQESLSIIELILAMCKQLKLDVVAEGVETASQLHLIHKIGCNTFQGFYFSKPIHPSDIKATFEKIRLKMGSEEDFYERSRF